LRNSTSVRALVLGAAGQLGRELVNLIPGAVGVSRAEVSVADLDAVMRAVESSGAELVFNCAAYNAVDRAEEESELAFAVNAAGPLNVAIACKHHGARLVHFSTNYVFNGLHPKPYVESDPVHPLGLYARSKAEGEARVLEELSAALVIRTAALYGRSGSAIKGGSFPERVVARARAGESLAVVGDQTVNPTYAVDLARAAIELAHQSMEGVVHAVAEGCCSWYEFAVAALEASGLDAAVRQTTTAELASAAQRPPNGCLSSSRIRPLRPWRAALKEWATSPRGA
jgi:dTDP-4-dehydrorhamnose reductase